MKGFKYWLYQSPAAKRYMLIGTGICILYFVLQKINHRDGMADFRVYYDAAKAILNDTQLYGVAFGVSSGFYKYSPFAALPFVPFALLPYAIGSAFYFFLIAVILLLFTLLLTYQQERFGVNMKAKKSWVLLLSTLFLADHFERELHLGNVNLFLMIMAFAVYYLLKKSKYKSAGWLYGLTILFKPHFLFLGFFMLWNKQWKSLLHSAIAVVFGLLIPCIWKGWKGNLTWLNQWLNAMQEHNIKLYESRNTVYGIASNFILKPLGVQAGNGLIVIVLLLVISSVIWLYIKNNREQKSQATTYVEFFVLLALIPNLVHTDTEHFMWTLPLIVFIISILLIEPIKNKNMYLFLMIVAFIPYCLNSPDLVGKEIGILFDSSGLMGVANLIFVFLSVRLLKVRNITSSLSKVE